MILKPRDTTKSEYSLIQNQPVVTSQIYIVLSYITTTPVDQSYNNWKHVQHVYCCYCNVFTPLWILCTEWPYCLYSFSAYGMIFSAILPSVSWSTTLQINFIFTANPCCCPCPCCCPKQSWWLRKEDTEALWQEDRLHWQHFQVSFGNQGTGT